MTIGINEGTQTNLKSTTDTGEEISHVRADGGTVGLVTAVSGLTTGTINVLAKGTISTGTFTQAAEFTDNTAFTEATSKGLVVLGMRNEQGTVRIGNNGNVGPLTVDRAGRLVVDTVSARPVDEFATSVSTGTSTLGTLKAAVSGSVIYVTDIKISVQAPSNVVIASGGTSTPIIGTNFFAGSGGMVANYTIPIRTASGSSLVYKQSANTGMTIDVQGYID